MHAGLMPGGPGEALRGLRLVKESTALGNRMVAGIEGERARAAVQRGFLMSSDEPAPGHADTVRINSRNHVIETGAGFSRALVPGALLLVDDFSNDALEDKVGSPPYPRRAVPVRGRSGMDTRYVVVAWLWSGAQCRQRPFLPGPRDCKRSFGPWSRPARCYLRYAKMTELWAFRLFTPEVGRGSTA